MPYLVHTVETYISLLTILLQTVESVHTCDRLFFSILDLHSIVRTEGSLKLF